MRFTFAIVILLGAGVLAVAASTTSWVSDGGMPQTAPSVPDIPLERDTTDDQTVLPASIQRNVGIATGETPVNQHDQDNAPGAVEKEGQPPMGGQWGVRYATITDPSLPRVLLIGDSIVIGYGARVAERLKGKANVDIWVTPNWLGPELSRQAQDILKKAEYSVIHFNESGLHAWDPGRIPQGQYGPLMRNYLSVLKSSAPGALFIWASTTPVTEAGKPGWVDPLDNLISDRNAICERIMQENGIPVDDLHSLMMSHLDLARGDRFHWVDKGYDLMADSVTKQILDNLALIQTHAPTAVCPAILPALVQLAGFCSNTFNSTFPTSSVDINNTLGTQFPIARTEIVSDGRKRCPQYSSPDRRFRRVAEQERCWQLPGHVDA